MPLDPAQKLAWEFVGLEAEDLVRDREALSRAAREPGADAETAKAAEAAIRRRAGILIERAVGLAGPRPL